MSPDPPSGDGNANDTDTASPLASLLQFLSREVLSAAIALAGVYVSAKVIKRVMDPNSEARERMRQRRDEVIARLQRTGVPRDALRCLAPTEELLLHDLVFPEDIATDFAAVGGLRNTKETLKELIVYPLLFPDVYRAADGSPSSSLLTPPKGILLYGPPGTGKTMLAKALAKESGANFMALSPSSLLSKWLGDTEQLARAVFSLARRVQPTIIFIDEIDGLFRERSSTEHEAHKNLKAEFMQLWDGLTTDDRFNQVVVLGATNRPYDVDPAILRRMPRPFEVALPDPSERVEILRNVLGDVVLDNAFDFDAVSNVTEGYSGSDLKELCRAAMMNPIRESLRVAAKERRVQFSSAQGLSADAGEMTFPSGESKRLRPLTVSDVLAARQQVSRTQQESEDYRTKSSMDATSGPDGVQMEMAMRFLQALASRGA